MIKKGILLLTLLLILSTLLLSCTKEQAPPQPTPTKSGTPASIKPLDSSRRTAIELALKQDSELVTMNIKVDVINYTVTLSGTVDTEEQKAHAEEIAKSASGVEKVINKLVVNPRQ